MHKRNVANNIKTTKSLPHPLARDPTNCVAKVAKNHTGKAVNVKGNMRKNSRLS